MVEYFGMRGAVELKKTCTVFYRGRYISYQNIVNGSGNNTRAGDEFTVVTWKS